MIVFSLKDWYHGYTKNNGLMVQFQQLSNKYCVLYLKNTPFQKKYTPFPDKKTHNRTIGKVQSTTPFQKKIHSMFNIVMIMRINIFFLRVGLIFFSFLYYNQVSHSYLHF